MVPAPSSFSLAAARLGWALPDIALVSLHGRALDRIRPHLHPGARVLALTSDGEGPEALARLLAETGFGASRLTVLEALGGPRERIRTTTAARLRPRRRRRAQYRRRSRSRLRPARACIAYAPGLADDLFEHDGQITKREIRAVTLSSLAPLRGELLWDIGAGSGSVAIEWMLAHPSLRAVAIEARADRAARIRRNAAAFGVPGARSRRGPRAGGARRPGDARCGVRRRRRERCGRARCRHRGASARRAAGGQCRDASRPRPR